MVARKTLWDWTTALLARRPIRGDLPGEGRRPGGAPSPGRAQTSATLVLAPAGEDGLEGPHPQGERADGLGSLTELAGHDLDLLERRLDRVAAEGVSQGFQEDVAGEAQLAADDDTLGVEHVAEVG